MKRIPLEDAKEMPWKNGGGTTRELFTLPDTGDWDLRLSVATVASDGPFSMFPEVDRTLTVLTGEGVELEIAGRRARLSPEQPFAFPGDVAVSSKLLGGTVTDFNVMTRRGKLRHSVTRVLPGPYSDHGFSALFTLAACPDVTQFELWLPEPDESVTLPVAALWLRLETL